MLSGEFLPQLLDLHALLGLELLLQNSLHFLVDVVSSLGVIDDLLFLHPDLLLSHPIFKFVFFCLLDHISFEVNLLLEAAYLLPQDPFTLVRLEFVLLTKYLSNFSLLSLT